jgi:peptidoglycan/xylan/chitin deacetylase (PgdA/CDA1 family)
MISKLLVASRYLLASHCFSNIVNVQIPKPIICFTFDDVPSITFKHAIPILNNYLVKGTFYIAGGLSKKNSKYMNNDQIRHLIADEHEIGCHTYKHLQTGLCLKKKLHMDIELNSTYFKTNFNYSLLDFSYPCGSVGLWNKCWLRKRFETLRSTTPGLNIGRVDLGMLLANKLYSVSMSKERINELIDDAVLKNGWLIFYTHDVAPHPSDIGCTPDLLNYAIEKAIDANAIVTTIKKANVYIRNLHYIH